MPYPSSDTCKFLSSLQRYDLALLIGECVVEIVETEIDRGWNRDLVREAVVTGPAPVVEALKALPQFDRKRIAEAVASGHPSIQAPEDIRVQAIDRDSISASAALLSDLLVQREVMISVATGGHRIQDVDDYYRARDSRIRAALPDGVLYDNPHDSLWDWYNYWSSNLPQYKDRRQYVRQLFVPAIEGISRRSTLQSLVREPTGWERVDRALSKARSQLGTASAEEDYQAIGLLCREVIISLAQAVFDPSIHHSVDGVAPSSTDANRMIEGFVEHVLAGSSNKEVRAHARASLALALNLQHRRTATRQLAELCVEATSSTTAVISIIARGSALHI